jgi:hypothetical protein
MTQSQRKWTVLETVASIAVLATSGWAQGLERVSVTSTGGEPNDACSRPVLSGDGDVVAFFSRATNLVPGRHQRRRRRVRAGSCRADDDAP